VTTLEALADAVATACKPLLDAPFALFGHSLGAALGYEVALRLEQAGHPPLHLFVSARRAPNAVAPAAPMAPLSDDAFVREVQARYGPIPAAILEEPELMALLLPKLRADVRMNEEYLAPARPVACSVTALGGVDDASVTAADLDGWATFTRSRFRRHLLPGGHFFIRDVPAEVIPVLREGLQNAFSLSGGAA
jgi:surfactin synthase thioesterase subunit